MLTLGGFPGAILCFSLLSLYFCPISHSPTLGRSSGPPSVPVPDTAAPER